ncbi:hypothetical protein GUJ93_ZPchr0012g20421 [Zizania palustris]|uniref:Uncharacterized protein n=1 Tax=Zizania palustris TaxID=103762 RepID=A0A8J6BZQ0_ZIZPA|nr:hypothetical protein GUJ93_ZPchr0012g20421 [Zizania palustris]
MVAASDGWTQHSTLWLPASPSLIPLPPHSGSTAYQYGGPETGGAEQEGRRLADLDGGAAREGRCRSGRRCRAGGAAPSGRGGAEREGRRRSEGAAPSGQGAAPARAVAAHDAGEISQEWTIYNHALHYDENPAGAIRSVVGDFPVQQ